MKSDGMTLPNRAFTLVELLLGMTIMALVIGSVYSGMKVGMEAYMRGQYSMELYQSARIGLRQISDELRLALSPFAFWRPQDSYKQLSYEEMMNTFGGPVVQEEDPGAIRFMGQSNSVLYVRKVYQLDRYPPFDLQECRIFVNQDSKQLILEIVRSLLAVKQASWFYRYEFQLNLAGQVIPMDGGRMRFRQVGMFGEPPIMEYIGDYGVINKRQLIAEGIDSIQFRYSSGSNWTNHWDSQQLITEYRRSPQSPRFNMVSDVDIRETGPPQIAEISLKLENGDTVTTAAYIPAGNMRGMRGSGGGIGSEVQSSPPSNESPVMAPSLNIR
ncbi:MAG: prepilin-type N-terminal cleavage/methylation domain-containing protein [Candidatus Omnitrophota bacterium]|jgi:prepilin-type N-terminal cleavage/methylation domain-containing protein|nr:MAG: prepilin-type N-terminal cleavage/methylation domain-containing protein [Candidatus Omnitrophota bacterium]